MLIPQHFRPNQNQLPKQLPTLNNAFIYGAMNTPVAVNTQDEGAAANVVQLTIKSNAKRQTRKADHRFSIIEFLNSSGTNSFRVGGYKRDGTRIRENYADEAKARARQIELETEWLMGQATMEVQATKLTREQISLAESAFIRLGPDRNAELTLAVEHWLRQGRETSVSDSPRLDEAADAFCVWLRQTDTLRSRTKSKLRIRLNLFRNSVANLRVSDIGPDVIEKFLSDRKQVSQLTKIGDREAVSRFFSWCADRPRRWVRINPCSEVRLEKRHKEIPPALLTLSECRKLLRKAETHREGMLAPYVAVCLFGGLRPAEVQRLSWDNVNLVDGEIRVEAQSTKTKQPRVVSIGKTLRAWLEAYKGKAFKPSNIRRDLDVLKQAAGYTGRVGKECDGLKPWPPDVLRHTAISHYFRQFGSYGLAAEWAGNSEQIIKRHYQGRVSSEDTKKFYALMPRRKSHKNRIEPKPAQMPPTDPALKA